MNSQYKILVVDDDDDLREVLTDLLKSYDFNVLSANSGKAAFDIAKNEKIDLIISDIKMANWDGMEMLRNINTYLPDVPVVVFMTGYHEYTEEECLRNGAKDVLRKPFDTSKIINIVKNSLEIE